MSAILTQLYRGFCFVRFVELRKHDLVGDRGASWTEMFSRTSGGLLKSDALKT